MVKILPLHQKPYYILVKMPDSQYLKHVYFMPGMAANISIFENIKLPSKEFKVHYLKWLIPEAQETLQDYAKRLCELVKHNNVVLIGVSFGGLVVQEMAKIIPVNRLIIISSVKTKHELPNRMKLARKTGLYKLLPTSLVSYVHYVESLPVGSFLKKRARLYQTYLSINDKQYLDWAIKNMVCWDQEQALEGIIHINGDADIIFPIQHLKNVIAVEGGTHIMIINKYRWFNKNLPELIRFGKLPE